MGEKEQRVTKTCKQVVSLLAWIILGNFVYALGVAVFVVPGGLVTGGTTGIGLAVQHAVGIPLAPFVGAFNLVMFAVGLVALGKTFALSTLASTIAYPSLLGCVQGLLGDTVLTTDPFLCALFGGLCIGCGLGLVIRLGAST
ncbi:MAG: YitT family protein, partial [Coriobacteriaceae bacterium]|nr:YitT family protein [Coriobacteriaceae bacterium]